MLRTLRFAAVALMVGLAAVMVGVQPAGAAGPRHGVIEGRSTWAGTACTCAAPGRAPPPS